MGMGANSRSLEPCKDRCGTGAATLFFVPIQIQGPSRVGSGDPTTFRPTQSLLSMNVRAASVLACSLFVFLSWIPSVYAQEWRQTVQVITTIRYDEPLGVFADSLSTFLARHPTTLVRRTAQDPASVPFTDLREQLYEDGVEVRSVTHALVRYRFAFDRQSQLVETIEDVNFIYREDESQADLALLYVDFDDPTIDDFMRTQGIRSPVNMASVTSFRRLLSFPFLRKNHEMVITEIGGKARRSEAFTSQQQVVVQFLSGYSEVGPRSYILATKN